MLLVGLNPFGLTYTVGIQGHGTSRANPDGVGLEGFIHIAVDIGAQSIELPNIWLSNLSDEELDALRGRLADLDLVPVIGSGLVHEPPGAAIRGAVALGAKTIRLALTGLLCGDRGELGDHWPKMVEDTRNGLRDYAKMARDADVWLAIENHQDFGSEELLDFCEEAGPNVGICYDTGNSFPVAEAPIPFTHRIAPRVRHVHLKDYTVQFTDEGYRLVRCAFGDGAVPGDEIVKILDEHHDALTASIEIAALDARHIRLLTPGWWHGYPPITGADLAACFAAARHNRLPSDVDHRTLWEREEEGPALVDYELDQVRRSAKYLKEQGIMLGGRS
ncbi:sugar phosphate isomerase/epimerase family protein [Bauldia sp.]|uniref:sugar phosphate isomerase/epimerase family protein n=1 Tax=Bauldia sp. TaxID=2575872 RepID=UPI003BAAAFE0